jgi:predicted DNA-binding transcriptional regulator AlpA
MIIEYEKRPKFIKETDAANWLGLSVRTLQKHRVTGSGPRFHKFGGAVRYRFSDLEEWCNSCCRNSTSENSGFLNTTALRTIGASRVQNR